MTKKIDCFLFEGLLILRSVELTHLLSDGAIVKNVQTDFLDTDWCTLW